MWAGWAAFLSQVFVFVEPILLLHPVFPPWRTRANRNKNKNKNKIWMSFVYYHRYSWTWLWRSLQGSRCDNDCVSESVTAPHTSWFVSSLALSPVIFWIFPFDGQYLTCKRTNLQILASPSSETAARLLTTNAEEEEKFLIFIRYFVVLNLSTFLKNIKH